MKFSRGQKLAGAVIALLSLMGAECGGTSPSGGDPVPAPTKAGPPKCEGINFQDPEERCFTLQAFVESRLGSYDVYLNITGGAGTYPKHVPDLKGGWKHALVYRSGVKLKVTMTLAYEGAKSNEGFCAITDGGQRTEERLLSITAGGGSPYRAVCELTTNQ